MLCASRVPWPLTLPLPPFLPAQVHIDKGMEDEQHITFTGESNQEPGVKTGDVVIVLDQREHETFQRRGNDLLMQMVGWWLQAPLPVSFSRMQPWLGRPHAPVFLGLAAIQEAAARQSGDTWMPCRSVVA